MITGATVTIETIDNGYLLKTQHGMRVLYADGAQTLFTQLLRELEDRHPDREGTSYGKVTVEYVKDVLSVEFCKKHYGPGRTPPQGVSIDKPEDASLFP